MKTSPCILAIALATAFTTAARAQTPANPAPNETIYVQQLPTPSELTGGAGGGVTVARIDQTGDQVTVVYKYANGQTNTVVYKPIAAAASAAVPVTTPPPAVPATTQTVVYAGPAPVYYYYPAGYCYPGYYSWGWYPPVTVRVGFGFHYFHGGFRGGFRGHWR
ncbi:MAG TPA: hypothetical protein VMI53_14375 [Opitutaceae bacterium]|nr:hypothetical protein [Opitutaceae bacterium]